MPCKGKGRKGGGGKKTNRMISVKEMNQIIAKEFRKHYKPKNDG